MKIIKAQKGGREIIHFFVKIVTMNSPMELVFISRIEIFSKTMGFTILNGIDNEYSGDTKKRLSQFIFVVLSPNEFFATKVNNAVKKTKKLLWELSPSRHEIDMEEIKGYYLKLYGKEKINFLISLIKENFWKWKVWGEWFKKIFFWDFYNLLAKMVISKN